MTSAEHNDNNRTRDHRHSSDCQVPYRVARPAAETRERATVRRRCADMGLNSQAPTERNVTPRRSPLTRSARDGGGAAPIRAASAPHLNR